jgi:hypothetical protein
VIPGYEQLFRSLRWVHVQRFVVERQQEDLHLEFKTAASPRESLEDRHNLARALSGFANSAGGMVVWGVRATKDANGIDAASTIMPIIGVRRFASRLLELTADATDPPVEGIEHRYIVPRGKADGIALSLVPESHRGPHMAKLGLNHYYKRSGASFYMMEHYDLADMFGKRPRPQLGVATRLLGGEHYSVVVGIENRGRGTARTPFMSLRISDEFCVSEFGLDGNGHHGLAVRPTAYGLQQRCFGGAGMVVFPESVLEVTIVRLRDHIRNPTRDLVIDWEISAEDLPPEKGQMRIGPEDIRSATV